MPLFEVFTAEDWADFSGAIAFDDGKPTGTEPVVMHGSKVAAVIDKTSIQVVNQEGDEEFRIDLPPELARALREMVLTQAEQERKLDVGDNEDGEA